MWPSGITARANGLGKRCLRRLLEIGQNVGVDVLPRHFYSQVPDFRALGRDQRWQRPYSMAGVRGVDVAAQLRWLEETCPPGLASQLSRLDLHARAAAANGAVGYGPVESDILYCLVRSRRPRRMIQIGAGASTWVALQAARDGATALRITAVDPYPTPFLERLAADGDIELLANPVQGVDVDLLASLAAGDVLFVDSTHTVSAGSDVNYLILEVLPRLTAGVLVHFHDVTMPYDYGPGLMSTDLFFWSESVLLHAYLADNPRVEIRLGCAMLHDAALDAFRARIPTYDPPMLTERGLCVGDPAGAFPSAMWLEVTSPPAGARD